MWYVSCFLAGCVVFYVICAFVGYCNVMSSLALNQTRNNSDFVDAEIPDLVHKSLKGISSTPERSLTYEENLYFMDFSSESCR